MSRMQQHIYMEQMVDRLLREAGVDPAKQGNSSSNASELSPQQYAAMLSSVPALPTV